MQTWPVIVDDPKLHNRQLTSLRGIACLVVLLGHVVQVINYRQPPLGSVEQLMREAVAGGLNAEGAVLFFFVLSGCVLAMSLNNLSQLNGRAILGFYVKRIFRLYPLLWLATGLAVVSVIAARHLPTTGIFIGWLTQNLHARISPTHIVLSLFGVWTKYDGPMWSLRVELIYSGLFPAIYMLIKSVHSRGWLIAALLMVALLPAVPSQLGTAFGLSFALGALIPMLPRRAGRYHGVLAMIALLALLYDRLLLGMFHPRDIVYDLIETLASFVIIREVYVYGYRYRFLLARPVAWLGELSFSIYLLHLPILLLIFSAIEYYFGIRPLLDHSIATPLVLGFLTGAITICISAVTYQYIELPLHNIGRRFGAQIARGRATPTQHIILDEAIASGRPLI